MRKSTFIGIGLNAIILSLSLGLHYSRNGFWPLTEHPYGYYGARPTKTVERLFVNTTNEVRTVADLTEEEGISQLVRFAKVSQLEEAWVYIPPNKWIEVGKEEKKDEKVLSVVIDDLYLQTLFRQNDTIKQYHIHPPNHKAIEELEAEWRSGEKPGYLVERLKDLYFTLSTIPSPEDIKGAIQQSLHFYRIKPQGSFSSGIISSLGVTEYSLTVEGRDYFKDKSKEQIMEYANKLVGAKVSSIPVKEAERIMRMSLPELLNPEPFRPAEIARGLSDSYVTISFTPVK